MFNKNEKDFKKSIHWYGKFEKRILTVFLLSSIIPVLILGVILYFTTIKNVTNRITITSHNELVEQISEVDNVIELMEQHYFNIVNSAEVNNLVENNINYKNYTKIIQFTDKMVSNASFINYIKGFTLINFDTGWAYSNAGVKKLDTLNNKNECLDIFNDSTKSIFWINNQDIESSGANNVDLSYISLAYRLPLGYSDKNAMLIINLYKSNFEKLFKSTVYSDILVFDENGKKVYGEYPELDDSIIDYIYNNYSYISANDIIDINYDFNNEQYHISFKKSNLTDWIYVSYFNSSITKEDAKDIIYIAILLSLCLSVIIFLISTISTHWIYQPIKNIYINVRNYLNEEMLSKDDELALIEKGVHTLYNNNIELESILDKQKDQLYELFMLRLLRGQLSEELLNINIEKLQIEMFNYISVILMNSSLNVEGSEITSLEKDILHIQIAKNMPLEIRSMLMFSPVNNLYDVVMVVGANNENELDEKIIKICEDTSKFVYDNYGQYSIVGISKKFNNLILFPQAFREASEAIKRDSNTEYTNSDKIYNYFSDFLTEENTTITYNIVLQNEIKESVDLCNEENAFILISQFVNEIKDANLEWNEQYYFLYRLLVAILVTGADAGLSLNSTFEFRNQTLFQQFNQLYTLQEIEDFYKYKVTKPLIDALELYRKSNQSDILTKIEKLVIEKEGNITLTECAEAIDCHVNTIWRIMKNHRNQTFSDYVSEVRLEKAEDLLSNTDLSINEIAEILNYTNAQNFIRYFKKHREITPGKFRQDNRK